MKEYSINYYQKIINKLKEIAKNRKEEKTFLLKNINELEKNIEELKEIEKIYFLDTLKIAFIGQVGVGKSTIISSLLPKIKLNSKEIYEKKKGKTEKISKDKFIKKSSLLPVGDGRTTLAPITVFTKKDLKEFKIKIEMFNRKEVEETVENYLNYFLLENEERKNYPLVTSELRSYLYHRVLKKYVVKNLQKKLKRRDSIEEEFEKYLKENKKKKEKIKNELIDLIYEKINFNDDTVLNITYNEKNFENLFKKNPLFKTYLLETLENKRLRFIKEVLKKINNGEFSYITLPKKIEVYVRGKENLILMDTKGTEKYNNNSQFRDSYYVNSEIEKFAKDDSIISIFISSLEDAPSFDIREIFAEKSLKEKFNYKSGLLISLKKEIDTETYEKKLSDCKIELPELKDYTGFYYAYYNFFDTIPELYTAGIDKEESFFDYIHRINANRLNFLNSKKELLYKAINDKFYLFQNALTEEEFKQISNLIDFIKNEKVFVVEELRKKMKSIKEELIEMMKKTHHMVIYAMTRRYGKYAGFDFLAYMRIKADNYIEVYEKMIEERVEDKLKQTALKKEIREKINRIFKVFFIEEGNKLKEKAYQYVEYFKNDKEFWEKTVSEYGKGTGYKQRVINHFKQNRQFSYMQKFIENEFKKAVINEVLDNFIPLFKNEEEKKYVFGK
jgi:hypothetical protein